MTALFEYEQYMPHGMCLLWEPWLVLLWAGADLLIFISYMLIPLALIMVLRKRPDIRHRGLVTLFAGFILLCGVTHALSIITLWTAIYPLMGSIKMLTGIISLATAFVLFRLIPTLVRIPTPDKHEEVIEQLSLTLNDLRGTRDKLEERVEQRTEELEAANLRLAFTARDAVQRSRNLIQVVSSLTQPGVDASRQPESFLRDLRGRINALTIATSTVLEHNHQSTAALERVIRRQVEPLFSNPREQLQVDGPPIDIGAQGAQQVSLVVWELASRLVQAGPAAYSDIQIHVGWSIVNAPDQEPRLQLEWREQGVPEIETLGLEEEAVKAFRAEELSEFGDVLLTRIVPKLLKGTGEVTIGQDAFVYRLDCELRALIDFDEAARASENEGGELQRELMSGV